MAESLFSIANSLIENLASIGFAQVSQVLGVYDDLQQINRTLSIIKALLLDAEKKWSGNGAMRVWLKQLEKVFNDAQDLLDEHDYEKLRKQVVKANVTIKDKVRCFFSSSNPLVFRYRMAAHVKRIKKRLDLLATDRDRFGLQIIDNDRRVVDTREMSHSNVNASDVIGRENEKESIVNLLMQHNPNDRRKNLPVLSIVGMPGLGKTTLAKLVFNDERIAKSFTLRLWVCLSDYKKCGIKHMISRIVSVAESTIAYTPANQQHGFDKLDMEQLSIHLRNRLANRKLLLVLDDLSYADCFELVKLRDLMHVVAEGSKILVTTFRMDVADAFGTIPACHLEGLTEQDSLSLFEKWAFKEGEYERYDDGLFQVGRDIVRKCEGNPLALITLGSLLFSKVDRDQWIHVRDSETWDSMNTLMSAIKISYGQMPSYLKQCFALFCLYPTNYAIDSFRVASLWGALGLLPSPNSNQILKHGVNQYLDELHSRSFIQDFVDYGLGSSFKIHGLMHDLAFKVAGDGFRLIRHERDTINGYPRHLSFMTSDFPLTPLPPSKIEGVRTILFPIAGVGANRRSFLRLISRCKYLRFLDLSDSTYETLPESIDKLKHLRYLSLDNNKRFKRLPSSICKLHKLEFLVLSGCSELEALPKGFRNLINLQHLEITTKLQVLPEDEIAKLSSLRTLRFVFCNNLESLFGGVTLLTLRVLIVSGCSSLMSLPLDVEHFPMLETLSIDNCDMLELPAGHSDQNSNLKFKNLHFVCLPQLVTLPHWLQGSSKTLQYLLISSCNNLVELPEWLSSMKLLRTLRVTNCHNMLSLPNDTHFLTTIKNLEIDGYPELFGVGQSQWQVGESSCKHASTDEPRELEEVVEELE